MRIPIAALLSVVLTTSAFAQTERPDPTSPPPPRDTDSGKKTSSPKRTSCRAEAESQGLRGQKLRDHVQLCVQQARLDCLKQAIDKNITGRERVTFVRDCSR